MRRLCKGLESANQGARQGFALSLATVVRSMPCVGTSALLEFLDAVLDVPSTAKVLQFVAVWFNLRIGT